MQGLGSPNFCTYRAAGMLKINNLVALQVQNFWTTEALHLDRFNCTYIFISDPQSMPHNITRGGQILARARNS